MSQILKLGEGESLKSKKNQELQLIQQNRQRIQDAYESGQMSDNVKAQLDMISENAKNYLQADPLTNKNARKFQLSLTQRMVDILDGKEGYTPFGTEIATKNYWGKYDDNEINNITNELIKKTLSGSSNTTSQNLPTQTAPEDSHYVYNWTSGTDYSLLTPESTTRDKINLFANDLLKTIDNLQVAQNSGKIIHGFEGDLSLLGDKKAKLQNILSNSNLDDNTAFTSLLSVIQDGNLGVDPDLFKNIFKEFYGEKEESEKQEEPVIYRNQNLTDYLTNKGLHLLKTEDGKILLADQSGSKAAANFAELDPTSPYYQWGFFIDPNTGELLGADNLVQNPEFTQRFAEQWQALIPKIKEEYKSKFPIQDFTSQGGKKGIDFSNYIPGTDIKFIDTSNFDYDADTTPAWLPFDQWFDNWNDIKSNFNYKGLADVTTSGTNPQNQYARAMGFDPDLDLSEVISKRSLNDLKSEIIKLNPKSESTLTRNTNHKNFSTSLVEYVTKSICSSDPNNPNKSTYSAQLRNDYSNASKSHKTFKTEGNALMARMKSNPEILNQVLALCIKYSKNIEDRKSLIAAYKAFNKSSEATVNKEGGVLFLQGGGNTWADNYWDSFEISEEKPEETKTNDSNTSEIDQTKQFESEEGFTWKPEDTLRVLSLASDLGAIGASNAVGYGTLAAGGLGLLSTGLDYWADTIDKTVTKDQRRNTLGFGLGSTALGLIPDAKTATTGIKALKVIGNLARRGMGIFALYGQFGMAKEDIDRLKELAQNPDSRSFTSDDMRLILNSITMLASFALGKRMSNRNKTINDLSSTDTRKIPVTGKDGKTKYIEVTEGQFKGLLDKGKTEGQEAANAEFRNLGTDVADNAEFPVNVGEGKWSQKYRGFVNDNTVLNWVFPNRNASYTSYGRPRNDIELDIPNRDYNLAGWGRQDGRINWAKVWKAIGLNPKVTVKAQKPTVQPVATQKPASSTNKPTPKKQATPKKKQQGGKLDRLQQFINNK